MTSIDHFDYLIQQPLIFSLGLLKGKSVRKQADNNSTTETQHLQRNQPNY